MNTDSGLLLNPNNNVKKRPGPKNKTSGKQQSPLKLTIKRLSVDQTASFKVVNKKRGRKKNIGAMDEMIPDGRLVATASRPQTPSPTPSEILQPEGFLAPEALDSPGLDMESTEAPLPVNGTSPLDTFSDARGQEDSGTSSSGDGEPEGSPAILEPPIEQPMVNGNTDSEADGQLEQEGSDSGYEKEGSEKDYLGLDKADSTPTSTPPPDHTSPAPSPVPGLVGSLTVLAPCSVNSSVTTNGTPPPVPVASPGPARPAITLKSPAALMAPQGLGGAVSLLNIPPPTNFLESRPNYMTETCEVCGDRSEDIEAHRAATGHYKCHVSPDCAIVLFTSEQELRTHQKVTHGISISPPPQPSLEQLQQQVHRLPVTFAMPVSTPPIGTPPLGTLPPPAPASPGFRVPGGITLIQARPFAMQTSPSTIRPDGSPVTPPTPPQTQSPGPPGLPPGLSRSISISPAVSARPTQKRPSSPPATDASKKSRSDSPDCELVAVEKLPSLPSGISLTVRGNIANKETSGVANILASRGITVTPAAKTNSPNRAAPAASPLTTLNLSSAVSIVPASQSRSQFAVPQGRSVGRQATVTSRTPTVDLTTTPDPPARRRAQRFTCQVCDKVFTTQETLNQHLTTHRSPSKLPYKCTMCNAQYPTHHALVQHKNAYHKEAQGSEMAMPVIDLRNSAAVQKLGSLGVRHCVVISQLTNPSGGVFGIPIVAMDNARNPAVCNLGALGASNVLSLGPAKSLR